MSEEWHITEGVSGDTIWDGDRPIGTVNKDVAHRMAAAPDMEKALEALIADMKIAGLAWCSIEDGQAAIAKAKGGRNG